MNVNKRHVWLAQCALTGFAAGASLPEGNLLSLACAITMIINLVWLHPT